MGRLRRSPVRRMRAVSTLLTVIAVSGSGILLAGCGGGGDDDGKASPKKTAPTPTSSAKECGQFRIAYDPTNGYEASAFVVGTIAADELGCDVSYVKTTSRAAWNVVARGDADVYLDAYGSPDLARKLTGKDKPVVRLGPTGFRGGVDLLAPAFMGDLGLNTYQDLPDTNEIGWGGVTPAITTVPALLRLAQSFVEYQHLDYVVRDYSQVGVGVGMGDLLQQPRVDDERQRPNVYLVEGPREFLGDGPGRVTVAIPESAADDCEPDKVTTLCSLANFKYQKIANAEFANSGSPAYKLVYNYSVDPEEADNLLEIVELSGYDVGPADIASWVNTHRNVWKRWLD
jgi:glycine betaine/proline transport system substrate-binding protein